MGVICERFAIGVPNYFYRGGGCSAKSGNRVGPEGAGQAAVGVLVSWSVGEWRACKYTAA